MKIHTSMGISIQHPYIDQSASNSFICGHPDSVLGRTKSMLCCFAVKKFVLTTLLMLSILIKGSYCALSTKIIFKEPSLNNFLKLSKTSNYWYRSLQHLFSNRQLIVPITNITLQRLKLPRLISLQTFFK